MKYVCDVKQPIEINQKFKKAEHKINFLNQTHRLIDF